MKKEWMGKRKETCAGDCECHITKQIVADAGTLDPEAGVLL